MAITRVIPVLLLRNQGLVKSVKFKAPKYVGDPINAVRIFNDKEVDELVFLDITASTEGKPVPLALLQDIATECFMPLCYGGGIRSLKDIQQIIQVGVEKIALNTIAHEQPQLIQEAAAVYGSSSVVVSMDVKKNLFGKWQVWTKGGTVNTKKDPVAWAKEVEALGAGELMVQSIDKDGTMSGYDLELIRRVAQAVEVPVIACSGAGTVEDLARPIKEANASAVAAGSLFVFHGKHRAVLIQYPGQQVLRQLFS